MFTLRFYFTSFGYTGIHFTEDQTICKSDYFEITYPAACNLDPVWDVVV